jgi:hypothetical protein
MKASEVRLMVAIAAQYGCKLLKTDTKPAFLNGEIGDEKIYICSPDWWPEAVPQGQALLLMKSMYGTRQAARQWHQRISGWMESHDYMAVNNEKTVFMNEKDPTSSCMDCLLTIGLFLCICRRIALGSIASCDGISKQQSKFQTRISAWKL